MMIATPPTDDTCGGVLSANEIHAGCTRRLSSPDGKWEIVIKGDDDTTPAVYVDRPLKDDVAVVAERSGHVVATFDMQRWSHAYWLKDGRNLIVNYFAGSDSTRPLVFPLKTSHTAYIDLSQLVFPDVLRRIHKRQRQVYHYYVWFLADEGDHITIAAEPEFTIHGDYGPGDGRCLIYSVDKATFHRYRFLHEMPDDKCPEAQRDAS